jgi:hypothetical protein
MNDPDSRTPEGDRPQFSDHLRPALLAAAKLGLETACDGEWDEEDVQLENVCDAVHALDGLKDGSYTREQIGALAERAATMQGEEMISEAEQRGTDFPVTVHAAWPVTADAADMLQDRASLTRDLLRLRDEARG